MAMHESAPWSLIEGEGPLLAFAIHAGHEIRFGLREILALSEAGRLREEDPFTGEWTEVAPTRLVVHRSRFEADLNRSREKALYQTPEDAWGLRVWNRPLTGSHLWNSLELYDRFYEEIHALLLRKEKQGGRFVVLDLHSYNHRRDGAKAPAAPQAENPEVNLGTGSMDRGLWGPLAERWMEDLRRFDFLGRHLDVRENVKFRGGHLARWIHERFPRTGCALAVEFKKFFMDEWTGQPEPATLKEIPRALQSTVSGLLEELGRMG